MASRLTSKQYLFQLNLMYGAQAFFILVFGCVVFVMNHTALPSENNFASLMVYTLVGVVLTSLTAAHLIFNLMIRRIDRDLELKNKLQKYLTALLIRSALLEFPGLLGSVVSMVTGSQLPLITVVFIIVVFILLRPTLEKIVQDLNLSRQEKEMLENPEHILGN